jgi:hypothetical protein
MAFMLTWLWRIHVGSRSLAIGVESVGIGRHFYRQYLSAPCSVPCGRIATHAASIATRVATTVLREEVGGVAIADGSRLFAEEVILCHFPSQNPQGKFTSRNGKRRR